MNEGRGNDRVKWRLQADRWWNRISHRKRNEGRIEEREMEADRVWI